MCIIFGEGCMFKYCVSNKKMYYKIIVLNAIIDLIYLNCLYIPSDINYNNFKIQFLLKKNVRVYYHTLQSNDVVNYSLFYNMHY